MATTFTSLHVHVVFSTKNRERWLTPDVEEDVWRYLGGICRAHKLTALQIGGVEDHAHLFPGCPATVALSDFIKRLKGESSKWAWGKFPRWSGLGAGWLWRIQDRALAGTEDDPLHLEPAGAAPQTGV